MPIGAFGGSAEVMKNIAPLGGVYQAGTLSGNPVAVAAGITTLKLLSQPGFYEALDRQTRALTKGLTERAHAHGIPFSADSEGGMFGLYFSNDIPTTLAAVSASNIEMFKVFFHAMLDEGVYFAPSAYEAGFVSSTHDDSVISATIAAADKVFARLAKV
jgi:glutamate-1-semialdehyde 2,1-aminomutase